jgi:coproporphyrinogen III oxidase-like Fe-S oxidoreductase
MDIETINLIRKLSISLLSQENGIDNKSCDILYELWEKAPEHVFKDLKLAVEATDDAFYIFDDQLPNVSNKVVTLNLINE